MFNLLRNEFDRLHSTMLDESSFDGNYNSIVTTIIPDLNRQCKEYVKVSDRAVRVDVAEQLARETDYEEYKQQVRSHFASGTVKSNSTPLSYRLPMLKSSVGVKSFDIEPINQAYLLIGDDAKKYSKAVCRVEEYCDSFLNAFSGFEMKMVDYRSELLDEMRRLIPQLVDEYEAHLFRLRNSNAMGMPAEENYILRNGKSCSYGKSIASFVDNAVRAILEIDN